MGPLFIPVDEKQTFDSIFKDSYRNSFLIST